MTTSPFSRRSGPGPGSRGRDVRIAPPFEPTPVLALGGPAELIDSVPYLLGFHPRDSLVLVGLGSSPNGRDRVGVSARVDLADLVVDPGIVRRCTAALARSGAHSAVVLIYDSEAAGGAPDPQTDGDAPEEMPWRAVIDEVGDALEDAQLSVRDALLVGDDLWWSYLCSDPACCPPGGSARSGPGSRTAATATYAGLSALPDREALEGVLAPQSPDLLAPMTPLLDAAEAAEFEAILGDRQASHRRSVIRALFAAARASARDAPAGDPSREQANEQQPSPVQMARFGVALGDIAVRDACWLALEGGRIPASGLWRTLAHALPPPYDAQPLFLLGWQEWRAGNGTLAGIAASRALRSDPGCSAARLLLDALAHGLDPRRSPRL
ncbi:MAG: hypothetical protein JWN20_701, partial [Jatrophihabitantaceae bacterium]|nr:hypothetical protein [Jatrophihabitantaceae bacterium]